MMHRTGFIAWAIIAATTGWAMAENRPPTLDELLELPGLERELRHEGGTDDALDPQVQRRLSGEQAADLFHQAVRDMEAAAQKLEAEREAGLPTQRLQEEILAKLDQVIAAARQQRQGGSSNQQARPQDSGAESAGSQQQSASASDSGTADNPDNFSPGSVSAHDDGGRALSETKVEWGNLPPRLRDELQQGFGERFSPIYRDLTEAYYKRLAEEGR